MRAPLGPSHLHPHLPLRSKPSAPTYPQEARAGAEWSSVLWLPHLMLGKGRSHGLTSRATAWPWAYMGLRPAFYDFAPQSIHPSYKCSCTFIASLRTQP